jgi:hypothetical protein
MSTPLENRRPVNPAFVSESEAMEMVSNFCRVCDFYKGSCPCPVVGDYDQKRYALRDWCGWAKVGGVRIYITQGSISKGLPESPEYRRSNFKTREELIAAIQADEAASRSS